MNRYGIIQNERAEAAARPPGLPFRAAENAQKTHKSKSSGPPAAVPPVGGKPRSVQALLTAGRLLQSRDWPGGKVRIERQAGEAYPEAVARVIDELEPADRDKLRELVRWVMDYEDEEVEGRR